MELHKRDGITQCDVITESVTELHKTWRNYTALRIYRERDGITDTAWRNYIKRDGITQRDGFTDTAW